MGFSSSAFLRQARAPSGKDAPPTGTGPEATPDKRRGLIMRGMMCRPLRLAGAETWTAFGSDDPVVAFRYWAASLRYILLRTLKHFGTSSFVHIIRVRAGLSGVRSCSGKADGPKAHAGATPWGKVSLCDHGVSRSLKVLEYTANLRVGSSALESGRVRG